MTELSPGVSVGERVRDQNESSVLAGGKEGAHFRAKREKPRRTITKLRIYNDETLDYRDLNEVCKRKIWNLTFCSYFN